MLAELIAILIAMEYAVICWISRSLRVFCGSQSVVGLLTLNWTPTNHQDVTKVIKGYVHTLTIVGWVVNILWTPGHSDIVTGK